MPIFSQGMTNPGMRTRLTTVEQRPPFVGTGAYDTYRWASGFRIVGTARDESHTGLTHVLRCGTLMARTSAGERILDVYDPTATDGYKNVPVAVLPFEVRMTDFDDNDFPANVAVVTQAWLDVNKLYGFDQAARTALVKRGFMFVDGIGSFDGAYPRSSIAKTSNYTVLPADHGMEFTTAGASGAVTFTLPVLAGDAGAVNNGFTVWFRQLADQNMTIASAASGEIVALNNLTANSITFSTSSAKIGNVVRFVAKGGKWYYEDLSPQHTSTGAQNSTISGYTQFTGGDDDGEVIRRIGASTTEGLELVVVDKTVATTNATSTAVYTVPAGAVIRSVQANLEEAVTAGGTSVKVGLGIAAGDVDKYGLTSGLTQNSKIDKIPDWAVLSGTEAIALTAVTSDGSSLGDTAFAAGSDVRVRIVYEQLNSLDNA